MKSSKYIILTLIFCCNFSNALLGQSIGFEKVYGSGCEYFNCVRQTFEGGYIATGFTDSDSSCTTSYRDLYLVKTDAYGDTLWTKRIGNLISSDIGTFIEQTSDSGYIISGMTNGYGDAHIVKTDNSGIIQWTQTYGGNYRDFGSCVRQIENVGYIMAGGKGIASFTRSIYLIKTDLSGNLFWEKTIINGYGERTFASSVEETNDGGFILTGTIDTVNTPKAFLLKTDSSGSVLWTKLYSHQGAETYSNYVEQCSDGGFIMIGSKYLNIGRDFFLVRTDSSGNTIWKKIIDNATYDLGMAVRQTTDGGFIITGASGWNQCCVDSMDLYLAKLNNNGQVVWTQTFGTSSKFDFGTFIEQTNDGGFIISGATSSFGASNYQGYLLKLDSLGVITGFNAHIEHELDFEIFPNPVSSVLTINKSINDDISIIDILGSIVIKCTKSSIDQEKLEIDVSILPSGIYFIKSGSIVRKFIKH